MTTLIVGASGATGKLLADRLLNAGQHLKVIVRRTSRIPDYWQDAQNITIIREDNITMIDADTIAGYLADCDAVALCLGHTLSWKGIYGKPRKLVADMVQLLCSGIIKNTPGKPLRFILMNTAGNSNGDISEPLSRKEKWVLALLRLLLPPHTDNEKAADYLRTVIGQDHRFIEWAVVRPDNLIDESNVSAYSVHKSPVRSALFDAGKTSRINVASFIQDLLTDETTFRKWKGQMPVIYND